MYCSEGGGGAGLGRAGGGAALVRPLPPHQAPGRRGGRPGAAEGEAGPRLEAGGPPGAEDEGPGAVQV